MGDTKSSHVRSDRSAAVFIATSLDGFIARKNGRIDWLSGPADAPAQGPPEDFGYDAFFATVDALVMGRNTFELVLSFPNGHTARSWWSC